MPGRLLTRACRAALVLVVLAASACGAGDADGTTGPGPTAGTPSAAPALTFEQAVAALTPDLVPTADVQPCEGHEPGSAQADRTAVVPPDQAAAAATPALSACGDATVEAVRAGSLTGFAHGPGDDVVLPVAGGAARVVEVYELADAVGAAATYAARVADPEHWAADQEIPPEELEGGYYQPRRVVSGAGLTGVDLPGWTATVLSRDEAAFAHDGSVATAAVSYAYLWAVRDALVVRIQVAGDEPGAAAGTAEATARAFVADLSTPTSTG